MNKNQKKAVVVGAGIAALAAAAAGTYFFAGKRGAKNRAKVSKWVEAAKKEVVDNVKGMEKVTKQTYHKAVDTVLQQYENAKNVDKSEIVAVANELKGHWDNISTRLQAAVKPVLKKVAPKKVTASKAKPASKSKTAGKGKK